jgi:hypothetical protein
VSTSSRSSTRSSQGPQTPEQIAAQEDQAPTQDQTPMASPVEATQTDSRLNMLRDTPPPKRKELQWLVYEGRKSGTGRVGRTAGEHIDVIVPDEDNEGLVATYLEQAVPGGVVGDAARKQLEDAGLSHETIQLSGTSYHFSSGAEGPTPVHPDHVQWLLDHPRYSFKQVDESGAPVDQGQDGGASSARQSKTQDKTQE